VTIPAGYDDALGSRGSGSVQIVADGSDANSAGVSLGYATNLIADYSREVSWRRTPIGAASPGALGAGALEPRVRVWFNPRLQSRDFMIPGIVALLLLLITTNASSARSNSSTSHRCAVRS
jgi:ABC-2 type transport system permease protein